LVHPAACDSGREKNSRDVRSDHSQKHYAIHEQHLNPLNITYAARGMIPWQGGGNAERREIIAGVVSPMANGQG
jgi:hypothetical protein